MEKLDLTDDVIKSQIVKTMINNLPDKMHESAPDLFERLLVDSNVESKADYLARFCEKYEM